MVVTNLWIWSFLQGSVKGVGNVSAVALPSLQRGGKSVIIDVNDADNFSRGHIPDSVNFPMAELKEENHELLKHKDKTVILACQSGNKSSKAARTLQTLGFEKLHILSGGLMSWSKENLPLNSTADK